MKKREICGKSWAVYDRNQGFLTSFDENDCLIVALFGNKSSALNAVTDHVTQRVFRVNITVA